MASILFVTRDGAATSGPPWGSPRSCVAAATNDQRMIGRALEHAGAARLRPKSAAPATISSAVRDLIDEHAYRAAADRLAAAILKPDGAEQAANDLTTLLTGSTAGHPIDKASTPPQPTVGR